MTLFHPSKVHRTVYASGNLVCLVGDDEERNADGTLKCPPLLCVLWYDEVSDALKMEPVSWETAEVLAPAQLAAVSDLRHKAKAERWKLLAGGKE